MGPVVLVELDDGPDDVGLGRRRADDQARRDLVIRQAFTDQRHHLALPVGEQVEVGNRGGASGPAGELLHKTAGHTRGQQGIAAGHGPYSGHQLGRVRVFHQEAAGADAQRLEDILVKVEGGEDDDADVGEPLVGRDDARRLQAVDAGHADVHEEHVGCSPPCHADRLFAVARLTDDVDVVLGVEQGPETGPHQGLVVGQGDVDHDDRSTGNTARTAYPPPGRGAASRWPPNAAARSRMPGMPLPPPTVDGPAPAPSPSSVTSTTKSSPSAEMRTAAVLAWAWRVTLVRASCTMRYAARSTPGGRAGRRDATSTCTRRPVASAPATRRGRSASPAVGDRGGASPD